MAKCFFTGIDVPIAQVFVLDLAAAYRALKALRQRVSALERLIEQLGARDDSEIFDSKTRQVSIRKDRRVISPAVAEVLEATYPDVRLFISWQEWKSRLPKSAFRVDQTASTTDIENHGQTQLILEKSIEEPGGDQWCASLTPSRYSAVP